MKKTFKKTLLFALTIMMIFAVSVTAFAASVTKAKAESIALADAGYSANDVIYIKTKEDTDDGIKVFEVEFLIEEKGLYKDYDYEIRVSDGKILERDWEYEDDYYGTVGSNAKVGKVFLSKNEYTYNGKVQTPTVIAKDTKGKTLKNGKDYTVSYESGRKAVGRYTVKVTFKGNYSGTKKLTYVIFPKVTGKISATSTTSSITLTWKKVTGAEGYRVYQYNPKTEKYEKIKTIFSPTTLTYKVTGLNAGRKYKFKIKAFAKDEGTIWGKASSAFETATKTATPKITSITSGTKKAVVNWNDVKGESGYVVYYSAEKDSGFKKYSSVSDDGTKKTVKNLTSGKTYYFKVRSYITTDSGNVYSSWSAVKSVKVK